MFGFFNNGFSGILKSWDACLVSPGLLPEIRVILPRFNCGLSFWGHRIEHPVVVVDVTFYVCVVAKRGGGGGITFCNYLLHFIFLFLFLVWGLCDLKQRFISCFDKNAGSLAELNCDSRGHCVFDII